MLFFFNILPISKKFESCETYVYLEKFEDVLYMLFFIMVMWYNGEREENEIILMMVLLLVSGSIEHVITNVFIVWESNSRYHNNICYTFFF